MNGYAGFDFNAPADDWTSEALEHVRLRLRARGVLAAFPTLITDDLDAMVARAARYAELLNANPLFELTFPRLHIEGPFISPLDGPRGAHPLAYCRVPKQAPDVLDRLLDASGGRIGILTLAPELDGALPLIEHAAACGVCVGIGHTNASNATIADAVQAGATLSTHLGNGSHQVLPRLDNYVQTQLAEDALAATFIADGHHVPFTTLKNFLRAKTWPRSILVTDATAGADAPPGDYMLGPERIVVSENLRVSKPGQDNLAGSALTLDRAIINVATHCGVPFADAWAMASTIPAATVGLSGPPPITVHISSERFLNEE